MEKMTQEQLAEQMGISRRTVSRWETGNNLPDLSMLVAGFSQVNLNFWRDCLCCIYTAITVYYIYET